MNNDDMVDDNKTMMMVMVSEMVNEIIDDNENKFDIYVVVDLDDIVGHVEMNEYDDEIDVEIDGTR